MAIVNYDADGFSSYHLLDTNNFVNTDFTILKADASSYFTYGEDLRNIPNGDYYSNGGLIINRNGDWLKVSWGSGSGYYTSENAFANSNTGDIGIAFGIDDETEKGYIAYIYGVDQWGTWTRYKIHGFNINDTQRHNLYLVLKSITPPPVQTYTSNGGGATHIAKVTGQLKDLSSNLSDILIVSGGGGGGMLVGETEYAGADAGGISGSGDNSANQTTGYAFGQGESDDGVSGGGGGLYGGYKGGDS